MQHLGGSLRGTSANGGASAGSRLDLSKSASALSVCALSKPSLPFLLLEDPSALFLTKCLSYCQSAKMHDSVLSEIELDENVLRALLTKTKAS